MRGTWEQRQIWGTGNIGNVDFYFWRTGEQSDLFQGNRGTDSPGRARAGLYTKGAAADVFSNETISPLHGRCRDGEHIIDFRPQYLNYPESVTSTAESEHDRSNTLICPPSEVYYQPWHPQCLICLRPSEESGSLANH